MGKTMGGMGVSSLAIVLAMALFAVPGLFAAVSSFTYGSPNFSPGEPGPVQASQAQLRFLLDGEAGRYRITVFPEGAAVAAAERSFQHPGGAATVRVLVPLQEGANRFTARLIDLDRSSVSVTLGVSATLTRDLLTSVSRVVFDAIEPFGRTTNRTSCTVHYTLTGTAQSFLVEVVEVTTGIVAVTSTNVTGSGSIPSVPLALGRNDFYLRATATDTFSTSPQVTSGILTIVRDDVAPVVGSLSVGFPPVPTTDAVVNIQGLTEPFAIVTVSNGAGDVVSERASGLGDFSITGVQLPLVGLGPTQTTFTVTARDYAGNVSAPATVTADRIAGEPAFAYIRLSPDDGSYVKPDQAVHVDGAVGGLLGVPPYTVRFYARGGTGLPLLEDALSNLNNVEAFSKDLILVGDPIHPKQDVIWSVEAEIESTAGVSQRHFLGEVFIDVADPEPVRLGPTFDRLFYTRSPYFTLQGEVERRSTVQMISTGGMTFRPGNAILSEATAVAPGAEFSATVDIRNTPEGPFSIQATTIATSGRSGVGSKRLIQFVRDVTHPLVDRLWIDGVPASGPSDLFRKEGQIVSLRIAATEIMDTPPEVYVTQAGADALPAPLSAEVVAGRVWDYNYVVLAGATDGSLDGRVDLIVTGGADRAGNPMQPEVRIERSFAVDTLAPQIDTLRSSPADGTVFSTAPLPIRVLLRENLLSADPASGVDVGASTLEVYGPIEEDPNRLRPGTLARMAPESLEWTPGAGAFDREGTYRVEVKAVDRVGNTTTELLIYRVDRTSVDPAFLTTTMPPAESYLNGLTWPRLPDGTWYVSGTWDVSGAPDFDVSRSRVTLEKLCPIPHKFVGHRVPVGTDTVRFELVDPLRTNGWDDGYYTMFLEAWDLADNRAVPIARNFTYDTLAPYVMDGTQGQIEAGVPIRENMFPAGDSVVRGPLRYVAAEMIDRVAPNEFGGSGINTELSTGSRLELVLIEGHPTTAVPVGTSTTNSLSSLLHFESVEPEVISPCYTGVRRATAVRELRVDPLSGAPMGLATDGSHDGEWMLYAHPRDRAGNEGRRAWIRFTYDTIPPRLDIRDVTNGEVLSGATLITSGTAWDNDKTTHDRGQGIASVELRVEGTDMSGATTVPALIDWTAAILPPNMEERHAEDPVLWRFEHAMPCWNGAGRILVRATDRAGNRSILVRDVQISCDLLPGPRLVTPLQEAVVPGAVVTFDWEQVPGASKYLLVLRDGATNHIVLETDYPIDEGKVNLVNLRHGRYTWTVHAVDTQGRLGQPAHGRAFELDATAPTVLKVETLDATVPDAQAGDVLGGQIRLAVTFSELMDKTLEPEVWIDPADPTLPSTRVATISWYEGEWRGLVDVPQDPQGADWNGIATITIRGARDRAGNPMEEWNGGLEIDLGPWWELQAFANPILEREVIFHVRALSRQGGAPERISGLPVVRIAQEGAAWQNLRMQALNESLFYGTFVVDVTRPGDAQVRITGTDGQGNTTTRLIPFSVAQIMRAARNNVPMASAFLNLALWEESVESDRTLAVFPPEVQMASKTVGQSALGTSSSELPSELRLVAPLDGFAPDDLPLKRPATLRVTWKKALPDGLPRQRIAVFRRTKGRYVYQPGAWSGQELVAQLDGLSQLALLADTTAPRVKELGSRDGGGRLQVSSVGGPKVELLDDGAGIDPESLLVLVDDEPVTSRFDSETRRLHVAENRSFARGTHRLTLSVADRLGNRSTTSLDFLTSAEMELRSLRSYPNPSRDGRVWIRYECSEAAELTVEIFDASGRRVFTMRQDVPAGHGPAIHWDGRNRRGRAVASGVYFCRLRARGLTGRKASADTRIAILR